METPDTLPNFQLEWRPGCGDPASTMKWKSWKINIFFQKITKIPTFAKFKRDFGREGPSRWKGMTSPLFGHLRTKKNRKNHHHHHHLMMKKKNHKKTRKYPSYFRKISHTFAIFKSRYLHDQTDSWPKVTTIRTGILLRFFVGQKNFRRGASPAKNLIPKIVDIHNFPLIFTKISAHENSKIRYGPLEGAELLT